MTKVHEPDTRHDWIVSSREMQDILNSTHDAIIAVNKEGIIVLFNAAAERLLAMTTRQVCPGHHPEFPPALCAGDRTARTQSAAGYRQCLYSYQPGSGA
ncbi:PAS domain-containing protein [Acetonema longum]|uniref:PAS domain-containing protein n=1 Tax=Acetonema longum TaxID=2374 RepID=UPI000681AD27|nr:PAS domain-containing protein [Acetonema longum]